MISEVDKCKNAIDRMRVGLFGSKKDSKSHKFLITKQDGTQRFFKALCCEFDHERCEAMFYQHGQVVAGTKFTNVIDVEIVED